MGRERERESTQGADVAAAIVRRAVSAVVGQPSLAEVPGNRTHLTKAKAAHHIHTCH